MENKADAIEKIVYRDLTTLEGISKNKRAKYERGILEKLARLDALQEEIDVVVAKLKELRSYYAPAIASANIYQYNPPKPKPKIKAPTGNKPRAAGSLETKPFWQVFSEHVEVGGEFNVDDVAAVMDRGVAKTRHLIKHWKETGKIVSCGVVNRRMMYRRLK